jgi:hypothetical protein
MIIMWFTDSLTAGSAVEEPAKRVIRSKMK